MTRPAPNYRDRRRELARELADVPTPPPPADLLDAIRSEIPADLAAASEPAPAHERPWWRSKVLPLAASIAFVAVGAAIVLRNTDRREIRGSGVSPRRRASPRRHSRFRPAERAERARAGREQRKRESRERRRVGAREVGACAAGA